MKRPLDVDCLGEASTCFNELLKYFGQRKTVYETGKIRGGDIHVHFVEETGIGWSQVEPDVVWLSSVFVVSSWNLFHAAFCGARPSASNDEVALFYNRGEWVVPPEMPSPTQPIERHIAFWCWHTTAMWAFLHEFSHIWNGHLDFLKCGPLTNIERAMLEVDADCFASLDLAHTNFGVPWNNYTAEAMANWIGIPREDRFPGACQLYFLFFSIASVAILRAGEWGFDSLQNFIHPPLEVRLSQMAGTLPGLVDRYRLPAEPASNIVVSAVVRARATLRELLRQPMPEFHDLMRPWAREVLAYNGDLFDAWRMLRPRLEPLQRGMNTLADVQSTEGWRDPHAPDLYRTPPHKFGRVALNLKGKRN